MHVGLLQILHPVSARDLVSQRRCYIYEVSGRTFSHGQGQFIEPWIGRLQR